MIETESRSPTNWSIVGYSRVCVMQLRKNKFPRSVFEAGHEPNP